MSTGVKLEDLASIAAAGESAPRSGMVLYSVDASKTRKIFDLLLGTGQSVWYDPDQVAEFSGLFENADPQSLRPWKVRAICSISVGQSTPALAALIENLTTGISLNQLAKNSVQSTLVAHFNGLSDGDIAENPSFPKIDICCANLREALVEKGLNIVSGPTISMEPFVPALHETIEHSHFPVTPKGGAERQHLPITVTLDAPALSSQRFYAWVTNTTPVLGQEKSIDADLQAELSRILDNTYTTQELLHSRATIARDAVAKLQRPINDQYGFDTKLEIIVPQTSAVRYNFAGNEVLEIPLLGAGRNARFEVEYMVESKDDYKLERAHELDRSEARRKLDQKLARNNVEEAAETGDIEQYLRVVVRQILETVLRQAVGGIPADQLQRLGAFPDDGTGNQLDQTVNGLIHELFAKFGCEAKVRIVPFVDRHLHELTNGVPVDTEMRSYELAQISVIPKLRIRYVAYLKEGADTKLLTPYFQTATEKDDPFELLKNNLAERTKNIAELALGQLSPDDYLDKTGDQDAIRKLMEKQLKGPLSDEFGLTLRARLTVMHELDEVQQRYNDMRSVHRKVMVELHPVSQTSGEQVAVQLSLHYEVVRLANPKLSNDKHAGAISAWERFRNMALTHKTLEAHLKAFDDLMSATFRAQLERYPAEKFQKAAVDELRPHIVNGFALAGSQFGLDVKVIEGTINLDVTANPNNGIDQRLEGLRVRHARLLAEQQNDEETLDQLRIGGPGKRHNPFSNEPSNAPTDSVEAVRNRMKTRVEIMNEISNNLQTLSGVAALPSLEAPGNAHEQENE